MQQRQQDSQEKTDPTSAAIDYSKQGILMFQEAELSDWEGIVGKDLNSVYEEGKRRWLKIKVWQSGEFWAVGFTNGTGKRGGLIGALILEDDYGNYVGEVGTGFTDHELLALTSEIREGISNESLTRLKVSIKYLERTNVGKLRFPVYLGRI